MTNNDLLRVFAQLDKKGVWAYSQKQLRVLFRDETPGGFRKALCLRAAEGLAIRQVCRGLYVNPNARSAPANILQGLIPYIRPRAFNYVSMESVIGGTEDLSQIAARLVVISSARSAIIQTPFGDIEFVRSRAPVVDDTEGLTLDEGTGMWVAGRERALADFLRHRRAHDLLESAA